MPTFEYRCTYCDFLFEKIHPYHEDRPECPVCGSTVVKIIPAPALRFKGQGFHCTDYNKHGAKKN